MSILEERTVSEPRWRPRVALTLGDPNGIGLEVTLKVLADPRMMELIDPILIGPANVIKYHARQLGFQDLGMHFVQEPAEAVERHGLVAVDLQLAEKLYVEFGALSGEAGRASMQAVETAVDVCREGLADAMVTAPISKEAIALGGYENEPGHTDFIARRVEASDYTMMMVDDALRIGLVTTHIPIWDVPKRVTLDTVMKRARSLHQTLQTDFGIQRPRIAVLGLNPHAGDGGVMGREEETVIIPAIQQLREDGILATGPHPSDGFFAIGGYRSADAVLAMYHDQGLIPFKMLAFERGVNYTAGLPIVRTSPDHGTAFDIAGKGVADEGSMRHAIYLAVDIARRRRQLVSA